MTLLACSTMGNWPIIHQIAIVFGWVMNGIFSVLDLMGIHSVALCIILFTIITRLILLPLTIQQQKSTKLNGVIQPELQALQKKYAGRKDQESMQKMQMEQQLIYDKYGVSMTAGCLPSLISILLMFALYPVVYNLENYVPQMAQFTTEEITQMYTFFGIYLKDTPTLGLHASVMIPILAGLTQFISAKLMMANQPNMKDNPMASSMKTMNYMMPLMSVWFCFTFQAFIGVYWITMSLFMIVQQYFMNKWLRNIDVNDLVKANIEKKNKKRAKKGLPPLNEKATMATKNLERMSHTKTSTKKEMTKEERDAKIKESTDYYQSKNAKPGSLAAKANMVRDYNERHKK